MNKDTVRKCAEMAAAQQRAFLGVVDQDILDLLVELAPPPAAAPAEEVTEVAPAEEVAAEEAVEEVAEAAEEDSAE